MDIASCSHNFFLVLMLSHKNTGSRDRESPDSYPVTIYAFLCSWDERSLESRGLSRIGRSVTHSPFLPRHLNPLVTNLLQPQEHVHIKERLGTSLRKTVNLLRSDQFRDNTTDSHIPSSRNPPQKKKR